VGLAMRVSYCTGYAASSLIGDWFSKGTKLFALTGTSALQRKSPPNMRRSSTELLRPESISEMESKSMNAKINSSSILNLPRMLYISSLGERDMSVLYSIEGLAFHPFSISCNARAKSKYALIVDLSNAKRKTNNIKKPRAISSRRNSLKNNSENASAPGDLFSMSSLSYLSLTLNDESLSGKKAREKIANTGIKSGDIKSSSSRVTYLFDA
jgi:hypothetical protein